ncbi:MAG: hypothetical protein ACPHID_02205 [Thermoplasmatota archaeon]
MSDDPERQRDRVGQTVDKYFGTRLPPVCERLGCYLTDDGKRFYCVNPACQKHRKRATKHSRVPRKGTGPSFFRCPVCGARDVDVVALGRQYQCRDCNHEWPVNP